ncbi:putative membrane protein [Acidovorax sp. 69]|uniref:DMT family transporter n=1 Tax=Acidovorax sp. 69 TaxID=2035202 RepID=UPI000C24ED7D|nr:DMT family transporter [Acidovorax sp. 69]PJI98819.1 putative membrane protein [Acidovorax sp. 69]
MSASPSAAARGAFWRGLYQRPALLLIVTTLIWGSNAVAARLAVGHVSPMMLTTARWSIACIALWFVARQQVAQHLPALRGRWTYLALMGVSGFTAFNALFYAAAHHTTAVNLALIQGMIPVLVLLGGVLFLGLRVTALQMAGVVITLAGVAIVASRGTWAVLAALDFNRGDLWILLASVLYAGYTLGLRSRPPVPPLVFFSAVAGVAALASLPLLAAEVATGRFFWPTLQGWLILVYVGLLPSFVSQILFIRAVELIGPARASVFLNLNPVFGPALAVWVLSEPVGAYHALALAMVLGGIWIAERLGARR